MLGSQKVALIGAVLAASAPFASATPLPIVQGTTVVVYSAGSVTPATGPIAVGPLLFDTGYLTLTAPTFTAQAEETVFHDANNVLCAGCLTFAIQFTDIAGSANTIEHFTIGSFSGFLTDVGYIVNSGSANPPSSTDAAPISVDESLGGTLSFNFSDVGFLPVTGIQPGSTSTIFFVDTNAATIKPGFAALIDSTSVNMNVMVPAVTPTVPEPSSLLLLGTGFVGAAGMLLRRRTS